MKKCLTLLAVLVLTFSTSFGQTQTDNRSAQIKSCVEPVAYSVEDMLLKSQVGQNLSKPDVTPSYGGGLEELKKYFASHPLTDTKSKRHSIHGSRWLFGKLQWTNRELSDTK